MFRKIKMIFETAFYNFRLWRKNTRIVATFILVFILCFLLTDKTVDFSVANGTSIQMVEAFIITFGDSNSVLLSSVLLLLLYADMPFITAATPFFLSRANRRIWVLGQMLYIFLSTLLYLLFVLMTTCLLCMKYTNTKNSWSHTVATLAYSGEGKEIALPVTAKILEMSRPYQVMAGIFGLMLIYALVFVFLMLYFNIRRGQLAGVISALAFSVFGALLNPDNIQKLMRLPDELYYKARVWIGWISPLNHATYHMHNFGYDKLPRLWQTGVIFGVLLLGLVLCVVHAMKKYSFDFRGTGR